jgi:hypothetical protein
MRSKELGLVVGIVMGWLFSASVVLAGSLEPSVGPTQPGSQMHTLDQIYNFINNGTAATEMSAFTEPGSGPTAGTMHTLEEIYALAGQRAPVARTGQTSTVPLNPAPTGSDGALQKGAAWPNPRFTDNKNGTVTDNLTGLVWLKNTNCKDTVGGIDKSSGKLRWADALTWSNNLAGGRCDLIDGSTVGQWRLPSVKELQSLTDYAYSIALSDSAGTKMWSEGDAFSGLQVGNYWSSTTYAGAPTDVAWFIYFPTGIVSYELAAKTSMFYVWPVRGGH